MEIPTLLRAAEHRALRKVTLSGRVLDLGGDRDADYLGVIQGTFATTVVNLNPATKPDLLHDLEKPLPYEDGSFDHTLLMNVLEHIYDFRQLLLEAKRVTRPGGSIVVVVPYLFPYHASPRDYWRFSEEAFRRIMQDIGLEVASLEPLGSGVLAARSVMLDRLLPLPLRALTFLLRPLVLLGDRTVAALARMLGKKYRPADYAVGYCVVARK